MQLKHITRLAITAALLALGFDQLFWGKEPGISFLIFIVLLLAAGAFLTWGERLRPAWSSLPLLIPTLFFAGTTVLRQEPFTLVVCVAASLGCLLLLCLTWLGGRWWQYAILDYFHNAVLCVFDIVFVPFRFIWKGVGKPSTGDGEPAASVGSPAPTRRGRRTKTALSVLLGLLMAAPLLILLATLLADADPIFARELQKVLRLVDLKKLDEYLFRLFYISIAAHLLSGAFLYALLTSKDEKVRPADMPWLPAFMGWVEAITLLGCVDALFAFFVGIQLRYFFGGRANINLEGFTFSEYARRGFGELVAVAAISLLLLLGLSLVTSREEKTKRWIFSALGVLLVSLVGVMLVSAFQRLVLYEDAYGFTRLRTYTHVYIIWLGVLLLALIALELAGRLRYFALPALLTCLGFGVTLSLLNVDAFIARENIARALQGKDVVEGEQGRRFDGLDDAYLITLSEDALPTIFAAFDSAKLPQELHDEIGAALACRRAVSGGIEEARVWQSFHWSRERAVRLYEAHEVELAAYPVWNLNWEWKVNVNGKVKGCWE